MYPFYENLDLYIWDAIVSWRDHIDKTNFYNCSKSSYLTSMLKLIESKIVNVRLPLKIIDESWLKDCKKKIDLNSSWAGSTKTIRKSCLNTFYKFVKESLDQSQFPYQRHPQWNELKFLLSCNIGEKDNEKYETLEKTILKHVLSNVADKARARDICPEVLCDAVSKINERDSYIIWLIMHTGQPLEKILDLRKENLRASYRESNETNSHVQKKAYGGYLDFDNDHPYIPGHIVDGINQVCKNSTTFLFETFNGKRITRTQITRNLKQAGRNIGLSFDLTPKVLRGYVCTNMSKDKRSEIEKGLGIRKR